MLKAKIKSVIISGVFLFLRELSPHESLCQRSQLGIGQFGCGLAYRTCHVLGSRAEVGASSWPCLVSWCTTVSDLMTDNGQHLVVSHHLLPLIRQLMRMPPVPAGKCVDIDNFIYSKIQIQTFNFGEVRRDFGQSFT